MDIKPFWLRLRQLGFKRIIPHSRDPLVYQRVYEDVKRKLEVQLWRDGLLRVSFWQFTGRVSVGYDGYGRMSTVPTCFTTLEGMLEAIEYERTRPYERPKQQGE